MRTSRLFAFFAVVLPFVSLPMRARAERIEVVVGEGLKEPFGTAFDSRGTMYVVEMASGNRLLRVDAGGKLTTIAGRADGGYSGDGGPATSAQFNGPHNLAVLPDGDVLVGDTWNGAVRKIAMRTGTISTLPGFQVPVERARSAGPYCIALDPAGTKLYVANLQQIHVVDLASGSARVVAGNGQKGRPEDGATATEAPLVDPRAVAVDRQGNIYILERGGHALRVVGSDGRIRTVVNATGQRGATGDGGPALAATMNGPKHLCVDRDDSVLIADAENNIVRRFRPDNGTIERVAGTGKQGAAGVGGDPRECELARPHGVTVHPLTGELYITDSYNNRVLRVVK
jgi:DNA-binding beta-propeller fold protein YncE